MFDAFFYDQLSLSMTLQPLPPGLPSEPSASYLREYAGDTLRNVAYTFMFCVVAFVALRFYARSLSKSKVGADDLLLIPGGLCNIGICILSLAGKPGRVTYDLFSSFFRADPFCSIAHWLYRTPYTRYQS